MISRKWSPARLPKAASTQNRLIISKTVNSMWHLFRIGPVTQIFITCQFPTNQHVAFVSNRSGYSNIYHMPIPDKPIKEEKEIEILVKGERTADFESFHILNSKLDINSKGELAFISKSGNSDVLYIYDSEKKEIIRDFKFKDAITLFSPSWAPDNRQIAFTGIDFAGKNDLYRIDIFTGDVERLTNDFYDDRDPVWDHERNFLYFSSDRSFIDYSNYYNIFAYDLNSGEIIYITYGKQNDYTPAISPDNKYITFTSDRDGALNIWIAENPVQIKTPSLTANIQNLNGFSKHPHFFPSNDQMQLRKITNFTTGAHDPEWTNNNQIVFTAFEKFSFHLQVLDNVIDKFDSSKTLVCDSMEIKTDPHEFSKIVAQSVVSTVRYKPKFNLDVAQSAITQDPVFGTSGGAQIGISDMLGNYQYHFLVFNNAQTLKDGMVVSRR
ncbi:hypothetical protein B6I21_09340 [candidate division KSB1 bacterium 4572_119]|nr:MAG: hypothetical protein B6I21_09340 [candidate division KSB1 bacterium 4572_119]